MNISSCFFRHAMLAANSLGNIGGAELKAH
jgi:hypothetical protein